MGVTAIIKGLMTHPLNRRNRVGALVRFVRWQVGSRLIGAPVAVPFAGKGRLLVSRGMTGATGNVYSGLHDFEDMALTAHLLRPGDVFVDVGANVGAYTVLAAAVAGAGAVAVEPIPATFQRLLDNVAVNRLDGRVRCRNVGVGREPGVLRLTSGSDTVNHVLAPGEQAADAVEVSVLPLDDIVGGDEPTLIKIDVEGFETEVLAGGGRTFARPSLQAVLMELNGSGARYGFSEDALHARMTDWGFRPARYDPFARAVAAADGHAGAGPNTLFVRDLDAIRERVRSAEPVRVFGTRI